MAGRKSFAYKPSVWADLVRSPENREESGAFRKFETTPVMTQAEMLNALHVASGVQYAAPAKPAA